MKFILVILFVLFYNVEVYASSGYKALTDEECAAIIKTYKIDPKIKSVRGWNNVFSSEKWMHRFNLDIYTSAELDCIKEYILSNAMDIKKYNQFIGMEMKL